MTERGIIRLGIAGVAVLVAVILLAMSIFIIPEGHVGVVKRWQKADHQVGPGIHFKLPFADSVVEIDIRQRKIVEDLAASTSDQLAIQTAVSINWTVVRSSAIDLFRQYGGLDQFENRILLPNFRSATKTAIAEYPANELIKNRGLAVGSIMDHMTREMDEYPVVINSPQLENVSFPMRYKDAVLAKEEARENASKEKHRLEQQRLVALQAVNTANAESEAKRIAAEAEAYRVITEATAEADAIRLVSEQLAREPRYIELMEVKQWNGTLPRIFMGEGGAVPLLSLDASR